MAERRYHPRVIEPKWQEIWEHEHTWEVSNEPGDPREKRYVLEMLPYPSGEPHVGHLKNYALGDTIAHYRRRRGYRVMHPMGYDAFGLPAENNAIKSGEPPREATERSIAAYRHWFQRWGISIDWPLHVKTMQRNWIGRSDGAEVTFRCEELGTDYPVFTTRPDTLFGATFFVLAPEHPDVLRLAAGTPYEREVGEYVRRALTES